MIKLEMHIKTKYNPWENSVVDVAPIAPYLGMKTKFSIKFKAIETTLTILL